MSSIHLPVGVKSLLPNAAPALVCPSSPAPEAACDGLTIERLFPEGGVVDAIAARACLAGVLLFRDRFEASHGVSQELDTPEGSYWHGILHRREPDPVNAKYWMRRVGRHPIHERLEGGGGIPLGLIASADTSSVDPPLPAAPWDPAGFIDRCRFRGGRADLGVEEERLCVAWQNREMLLLLAHCCQLARGR